PAAGAKLVGFRWNTKPPAVEATADEQGRFTMDLTGERSNEYTTRIWLLATLPVFAPERIDMEDANAKEPLTIRLAPDVPLDGRILTLEGQPVPGVEIRATAIRIFAD